MLKPAIRSALMDVVMNVIRVGLLVKVYVENLARVVVSLIVLQSV